MKTKLLVKFSVVAAINILLLQPKTHYVILVIQKLTPIIRTIRVLQSNSSCNPTSIAAPLPLLNTPHTSALYDLDDAVLRKKDTEESTTNKE